MFILLHSRTRTVCSISYMVFSIETNGEINLFIQDTRYKIQDTRYFVVEVAY